MSIDKHVTQQFFRGLGFDIAHRAYRLDECGGLCLWNRTELKGRPKRFRTEVDYCNPRESQKKTPAPQNPGRSSKMVKAAQAGASEGKKAAATKEPTNQKKATKTSEKEEADPRVERGKAAGTPLTPGGWFERPLQY